MGNADAGECEMIAIHGFASERWLRLRHAWRVKSRPDHNNAATSALDTFPSCNLIVGFVVNSRCKGT